MKITTNIFFIFIFGLVLLSGCSPIAPQNGSPVQQSIENVYTSDLHHFSFSYPKSWEMMNKEKDGRGLIFTANDEKNEWGGTNLNLNYNFESGDVGMGWKIIKSEKYTNPAGINFALTFFKHDADFAKQFGKTGSPEDVMILIGTDIIPGLKMFSYNEKINPQGEQQLKDILKTLKTSNQTEKGILEGSMGYPSEGIPKDIVVCADTIDEKFTACTDIRIEDKKYTYGIGYKLEVPPGDYYVYEKMNQSGSNDRAYYSEFVTCGFTVNCNSHKRIKVTVKAGETVSGVDPQDWYPPN